MSDEKNVTHNGETPLYTVQSLGLGEREAVEFALEHKELRYISDNDLKEVFSNCQF
jgi:hypothetical protein